MPEHTHTGEPNRTHHEKWSHDRRQDEPDRESARSRHQIIPENLSGAHGIDREGTISPETSKGSRKLGKKFAVAKGRREVFWYRVKDDVLIHISARVKLRA